MNCFRKTLLTACFAVCAAGNAQEVEHYLAEYMNSERWFDLRETYEEMGGQVENDFMGELSQFFISHFFNRPDSAVASAERLLEKYQADLGGSLPTTVYLYADDLVETGRIDKAVTMLRDLLEAVKTQSGGTIPEPFQACETKLALLELYRPYGKIITPDPLVADVVMPVDLTHVPTVCGRINGHGTPLLLDTGAGVCVLTKEQAAEWGVPTHVVEGMSVNGMGEAACEIAVIDTLRLGGIVVRNVPFLCWTYRRDMPRRTVCCAKR